MNTYKKTIMALGMVLVMISQISNALDTRGNAIETQINTARAKTEAQGGSRGPRMDAFGTLWTPLLNGAVKTYIEDNSKVLGVKDAKLMQFLQGTLSLNDYIAKIIESLESGLSKKQKIARGPLEARINTARGQIRSMQAEIEAVSYQGVTGRANAQEMLLIVLRNMNSIVQATSNFARLNDLLQ